MSDDRVHIFELHGREYELHKLSATKSVALMTRLSRLFGDPLMRLIVGGAGKVTPDTEQVTGQALDALVQKLQVFERLKDDDVLDLARIVFPYVLFQNAPLYKEKDIDIDLKFNGYELDVLPVLWAAIRYNLSPLFEGFRQRFQDAAILKSMNVSP